MQREWSEGYRSETRDVLLYSPITLAATSRLRYNTDTTAVTPCLLPALEHPFCFFRGTRQVYGGSDKAIPR